jgi:hypothetical protein
MLGMSRRRKQFGAAEDVTLSVYLTKADGSGPATGLAGVELVVVKPSNALQALTTKLFTEVNAAGLPGVYDITVPSAEWAELGSHQGKVHPHDATVLDPEPFEFERVAGTVARASFGTTDTVTISVYLTKADGSGPATGLAGVELVVVKPSNALQILTTKFFTQVDITDLPGVYEIAVPAGEWAEFGIYQAGVDPHDPTVLPPEPFEFQRSSTPPAPDTSTQVISLHGDPVGIATGGASGTGGPSGLGVASTGILGDLTDGEQIGSLEALTRALTEHLRASGDLVALIGGPARVKNEWPAPNIKLVYPTITVLPGSQSFEWMQPVERIVSIEGPSATAYYAIGNVTLPLQIDLWTENKVQRRRLLKALELALFQDPDAGGFICVGMPYYYGETAVIFMDTPTILGDGPEMALQNEWRATIAMTAETEFVVPKQVALMAQIVLEGHVGTIPDTIPAELLEAFGG